MLKDKNIFLSLFAGTTFLFVVFLFSHFYIPGIEKYPYELFSGLRSGFEIWKVGIYVLMSCMAIFFFLFFRLYRTVSCSKNSIPLYVGVCTFLLGSQALSVDSPLLLDVLSEKSHMFFFWISLVFWSIFLSSFRFSHDIFLYTIFLSLIGLLIYGLIQNTSLNPFYEGYSSYVPLTRIISTLGNANYVAGFALMGLPIVYMMTKYMRWIGYIACISLLVLSGSWIACILAALLILFYGIYTYIPSSYQKMMYVLIFSLFILGLSYSYNLFPEKWYGIFTRMYLWKTGLVALSSSFQSFVFGFGFEGFADQYIQYRDPALLIYSDPSLLADRVHNIFLDIWIQLGIIPFVGIFGYVLYRFRFLERSHQLSLLLFLFYFSCNIPVLIHYLFVLFLISSKKG